MSTTRADRNRTLPPPIIGDPLLADRLRRPGPPQTARPIPTARRRHPAKGSRAAALVLSIGTTAGLTGYFYQADTSAASGTGVAAPASALTPSVVVVPATSAPVTTTSNVSPAPAAIPASSTTIAATTTPPANALADGTFVGQTFTNRWGPVQVQAVIAGGQITDVAALQTPGDRSRSIQITNVATPRLRTEVLVAQSAQIDTVSGATYTSNGYRQSLQSALDVARAQATVNAG